MDIKITTADPSEIDVEEVRAALEFAGYFVASITVKDRFSNEIDTVVRYV